MFVSVRIVMFELVFESRVSITACCIPTGLFSGSYRAGVRPAGLLHRIGELMSNLIVKSSSSSWMLW